MSHTFNLSVSDQSFDAKCQNWNKLSYSNKNITLEQLVEYVIKGHTFCHNFNKSNFIIKDKTKNNFFFAQSVFIDIDKTILNCNLFQFKESLKFKPNLLYTTPSDTNDLRSFRLVYIFEDTITSNDMYSNIVTTLINSIKEQYPNINIDNTCISSNQQYGGNGTRNIDYYTNYTNIYSTSTFNKNQMFISDCISKEKRNIIPSEMNNYKNDYMIDYWNLSITDILHKYSVEYSFFEHTPLNEVDEDTPHIMLPNNYISIKRYWYKDKQETTNGNEVTTHRIIKKKDGQGRKRLLFLNGILRRYMLPSISKEYMLTMLLFELYHFIDNRKDVITKKDIYNICNNVMKTDISTYNDMIEQHKDSRIYMSNPLYNEKYNVKSNTTKNIGRKLINQQKIGELFDCSLSVSENLKYMKENGLKICKNTLLKFMKENGLTDNIRQYNKSNNKEITMKEEQTNNEVKDANKSVKTIDNETLSINYRIGHIIKINRINKRFKMLSAA